MKKTVAHLLPSYNPFPPQYPAGTELRVEQVARRQRRYRPVVICGWFPGEMEVEDLSQMKVVRIRIGRVYQRLFQKITRLDPISYSLRMWKIIAREGAAVVHIHNEPKLLAGLLNHMGKDNRPVIVHVANEKPLPQLGLERVTRWVACSSYIENWLVQTQRIPRHKVQVIYTGVDATSCRPKWELSRSSRNALRKKYGVSSEEASVLVFAGRLVREKGVMELLDAFDHLRTVFGDTVELLIAGNVRNSKDPKNEKANYGRAVVERIERSAGVRWVGSLAPAEVHDFLCTGDIFVMPSLWHDPFPTVMLEAAAAGLPIVAASRGGVTEFLRDTPDFDSTICPEEPQSLAGAIQRLMENPDARKSNGEWLRKKVERHFDWSRVCDDFENLYDSILLSGESV